MSPNQRFVDIKKDEKVYKKLFRQLASLEIVLYFIIFPYLHSVHPLYHSNFLSIN